MEIASSLFIVKLLEVANPLKQVGVRIHFLSWNKKWKRKTIAQNNDIFGTSGQYGI